MSIHDELSPFSVDGMGKCYAAPEVANLLGYKSPESLTSQIRGERAAYFEHNVHWCYLGPEASRTIASRLGVTCGSRRMIFLSEVGLRLALSLCKLPNARMYQKQLAIAAAGEAVRTDAAPPSPPPAPALPEPEPQTALVKPSQMLRLLAEQAEKVEAFEGRLAALETRITAPPPQLQLPPKSLRAAIERHIKDNVGVPTDDPSYSMKIQATWQRLYLEFYDRRRIVLRPSNGKLTGLDIAEQKGVLTDLMALALELWPTRDATEHSSAGGRQP